MANSSRSDSKDYLTRWKPEEYAFLKELADSSGQTVKDVIYTAVSNFTSSVTSDQNFMNSATVTANALRCANNNLLDSKRVWDEAIAKLSGKDENNGIR